jgi:hypothetical protein
MAGPRSGLTDVNYSLGPLTITISPYRPSDLIVAGQRVDDFGAPSCEH